jgi:hypothetical protein
MLPISSKKDRYGFSDVLVPARALPYTWPDAPLAPLFASSSAFPLKKRGHAHKSPPSSQATHSA